MVGPVCRRVLQRSTLGTVPQHGVQDCDDLAHDGDNSDLRSFAGGDETAVKSVQRGVETKSRESRHVVHVADRHTTAIDAPQSLEFAAVEIIRRKADESGDLLAAKGAQSGSSASSV